jgi:hypothetical protein
MIQNHPVTNLLEQYRLKCSIKTCVDLENIYQWLKIFLNHILNRLKLKIAFYIKNHLLTILLLLSKMKYILTK